MRRLTRLVVGAALLVPALSSCGFDYASERVNTVSAGVTERSGEVDVVGAMVVAAQPGSGTFIALLANNSETEPVTFSSLEPGTGATFTAGEAGVEVPPSGAVSLANEGGVRVSGDFAAGDFVSVSVGFSNGERIRMDVPVVLACGDYEGLDNGAEPAEEPTAGQDLAEELEAYDCEPTADESEIEE